MKDYSELTSRIYIQLEPELSQEFHNMLTDISQELSRLYEIDNAKPTETLECLGNLEKKEEFDVVSQHSSYYYLLSDEALDTIKQALITKSKKELVFDIVVKKECDMRWLEYCIRENKTAEEYNNGLPEYYEKLTEEEFKLLKEVLDE